jgi:hypothetical protein
MAQELSPGQGPRLEPVPWWWQERAQLKVPVQVQVQVPLLWPGRAPLKVQSKVQEQLRERQRVPLSRSAQVRLWASAQVRGL